MSYVGKNPKFYGITVSKSDSGATVATTVTNTSNTASSKAVVSATVGGGSADDAVFQAAVSGVQTWSWGVDNSASDAWVLSAGATLGTTNAISVDASTQAVTLTTPVLGAATATTINKVTITAPASGSTLTIANGKTLTASNTLTFTGTDSSSVAFGAGGTVAYTANKLSTFAATTSSELAGVISDETGSGSLVFATSPTLTTPVLGVASATTINKVALTAPATGSTLTIADGKTLTASNTLTFTGTDASSVAFGTGGTVAYTANKLSAFAATTSLELKGVISDETGSGALVFADTPTLVTPVLGVASATSINKVAITAPATSATLTIANGKTLTASNTLTFTGTDSSSVAFGAGGTVAYTANKLSAFAATTSSELAGVISDETGSGVLVFGTSPQFTTGIGVGVAASASYLAYLQQNSSSSTATLLIENTNGTSTNGRALVRVTNGTAVLDLGADQADGIVYVGSNSSESLSLVTGGSTRITVSSGATGVRFNGYGAGTLSTNASGVISATSDSRVKQEVLGHSIPGLAEIKELEPKAYKLLSDIEALGEEASPIQLGFFADQVYQHIPEASPIHSDGIHGFFDRAVIAVLVNAVKELSNKSDALQARIAVLEGGV